ncbi:MAG: hypothetical protein QG608_255 [Actinomycetota bacterium]|nr:hypothetical protein [Actinomycetota bacterium]
MPGVPAGPGRAGPADPRVQSSQAGLIRLVRIGRQGIYDARRRLTAYELLFRPSFGDGHVPERAASEQATSQVIASTFGTFGLDRIADGKPLFINFTRAFLTGIISIPVEPANVIIELVEQVDVDHELLLGLRELRQAGYRIAVDDYRGDLHHSALLEIADFVKIRVDQQPSTTLPGLAKVGRSLGATLLAAQVDDLETFQHCVGLGFELFQGAYLQQPTLMERRTLSPTQLTCVKLLNDLSDPDTPVSRIEQLVSIDPGLTLRLLRTANSVASGSLHEVVSLRQSLVLLGPRTLRSWIVLTLLEGGTVQNAGEELWTVLARAHAVGTLSEADTDLGFTIGLLSGAADLLGSDPATVAEAAGVGPAARAALLDGEGPSGRALRAVLAHERDDPAQITAMGMTPLDVSRVYLEALNTALTQVHTLTGRR